MRSCHHFSKLRKVKNFCRFIKIIEPFEENELNIYLEFMKEFDEVYLLFFHFI